MTEYGSFVTTAIPSYSFHPLFTSHNKIKLVSSSQVYDWGKCWGWHVVLFVFRFLSYIFFHHTALILSRWVVILLLTAVFLSFCFLLFGGAVGEGNKKKDSMASHFSVSFFHLLCPFPPYFRTTNNNRYHAKFRDLNSVSSFSYFPSKLRGHSRFGQVNIVLLFIFIYFFVLFVFQVLDCFHPVGYLAVWYRNMSCGFHGLP